MISQNIDLNWFIFSIMLLGNIVYFILIIIQFFLILKPKSQAVKDMVIGKDMDWNDNTHRKSAKAFAYADTIIIFPLLVISNIGVFTGFYWGYIFLLSLGIVSLYFSILCFIVEKEYTYPNVGFVGYYTYYWGSYLYFGIASIIYSLFIILNA